jgi:hypothetical protein
MLHVVKEMLDALGMGSMEKSLTGPGHTQRVVFKLLQHGLAHQTFLQAFPQYMW